MSIEANVIRKFLIDSPHDFYRFIKDRDLLINKYMEFRIFRDHMFLAKNGCECTSEENEAVSRNVYENFNLMNQEAFSEIKNIMKCSSIIFKLNDKILFEL
jgi:hypothetical protein